MSAALKEAAAECMSGVVTDCARCPVAEDAFRRVINPLTKPNILRVCGALRRLYCPDGKQSKITDTVRSWKIK